jgi:hypothetical protein
MVKLKDVKRIFDQAPDRGAKIRTNPITGGCWVPGLDSTAAQIRIAWRALDAQAVCASGALRGSSQSLPLTYAAREAEKVSGGFGYAVSLFARSLADKKYVLDSHPPFDVYMSGLLARPEIGPRLLAREPGLALRFPPRPLIGLDGSGYFRCVRLRRALRCPNVRRRP